MNKAMSLTPDPAKAFRLTPATTEDMPLAPEAPLPKLPRYAGTPPTNPVYFALLLLVMAVGSASLLAWRHNDSSLENRASVGEPEAQYLLGKQYFETAMSPGDYARAARLLRKAAAHGLVKAQTALGLMYEHGLGVTQNYQEAVHWFQLAADQGYDVAQNELGFMYAKGRGVKRDFREAASWCRLAARQGSAIAERNVKLADVPNTKTLAQLVTAERKSYQGVVLQKVESDGITISFLPPTGGLGLAKVRIESLPAELQQLCKCAAQEGLSATSAYSGVGAVSRML
jgi:hypothetical protein